MSAPTLKDVKVTIVSFVEEAFMVELGTDFDADTNLFETQIIDSFGFVELVQFLESKFKIHVEDSDLVTGQLTSINNMCLLVEKRAYAVIHA